MKKTFVATYFHVELIVPSFYLLLLPGLMFFFFISFSAKADAQTGQIKATYGAWNLRCGRPPGSKSEKCALVQSVTAEDRPNIGLTVIFLRSVDGKKQILRIIAPLGVLLPPGLGLKIDDKDMGHTRFLKCDKYGCIAEAVVKDDFIKNFQSGSTAVFIIFQTPESGIGIPIQLQGFEKGLASLK